MHIPRFRTTIAFCAILLLSLEAHAVNVFYSITQLSSNGWRYDYTITNANPSLTFDELTIYFDRNLYGSLALASSPPDWDPLIIQADFGLPANGFFDALHVGGLVVPGATIPGFGVTFSYLPGLTPGAQPFDLLNSQGFNTVSSGITQLPVLNVAEPETFGLLATGLIAMVTALRRRT